MKVTTDGCLFGAWVADVIKKEKLVINNSLDIGTGTGLLSLMLLQKNPELQVDAIEIDKEAAEQATQNATASPWADRIRIYNTDIKKFQSTAPYDLIISNPPFYENELKSEKSEKNIAHHSNKLQLKDLLTIIKNKLSPEGVFCLLLPYKRNAEAKILLNETGLSVTQMTFVRQTTQHDFFRIMIIGKLATPEPVETIIDEISIKDNLLMEQQMQYSSSFVKLLHDYYLHLH